MNADKPETAARHYVATISVHGDTMEDVERTLAHIRYRIAQGSASGASMTLHASGWWCLGPTNSNAMRAGKPKLMEAQMTSDQLTRIERALLDADKARADSLTVRREDLRALWRIYLSESARADDLAAGRITARIFYTLSMLALVPLLVLSLAVVGAMAGIVLPAVLAAVSWSDWMARPRTIEPNPIHLRERFAEPSRN